ncbi:MAG: efflux RND transporter permease subunit [Flavobacteriales bacterium]|nr:efflux RND transporter permease subunit [Flavobacteriales bacterium]
MDIDRQKPEMPIVIDRAKAGRLNVSTCAVADAIAPRSSERVSTFRVEGDDDDYKIQVRLKDDQRYDVGTIMDMKITFRDMLTGQIRQVPISAVATEGLGTTFSAIKRTDLKRVVTVSSNAIAGYNSNEADRGDEGRSAGYEKDERFGLAFTGQQEDQMKEMSFLGRAFSDRALHCVPHHRVAVQQHQLPHGDPEHGGVQYHRCVPRPGGIPHGFHHPDDHARYHLADRCGGEQRDRINGFRQAALRSPTRKLGLPEDAELPIEASRESPIIAGKTRLRPVLLTAITAVLGLLPLAIGFNLNFGTLFTELNPHIHWW